MSQQGEHPAVATYLDAVCAQVQWRDVRPALRWELADHIAALTEAGRAAGLPEAEALQRAITAMGDPVSLGRQLHQAHRPRTEWGLLAATGLLVLLGLWAMYAVDASGSALSSREPAVRFFATKVVWSVLGLAAGAWAYFANYQRLQRAALPLYLVTLVGTAAVAAFAPVSLGRTLLDATPLLFVPGLAGLFSRWDWQAKGAWLRFVGVLAAPGLVYLTHSYGGFRDYLVCFAAVLVAIRPPRTQMATFVAIAMGVAGAGVAQIRHEPYLAYRLQEFVHPQQGESFTVRQSLLAIREAGFWGHGATASFQTLIDVQSVFVFPYLVHTLGWAAGAGICLLALLFLSRLLHLVRRVRDRLGAALVTGVAAVLAVHIGCNLLTIIGLVPFSVDFPFVSHGAQQVLYMAAVGLALGVFRRKDLAPAPVLGDAPPAIGS